jgi:hypothetical protein
MPVQQGGELGTIPNEPLKDEFSFDSLNTGTAPMATEGPSRRAREEAARRQGEAPVPPGGRPATPADNQAYFDAKSPEWFDDPVGLLNAFADGVFWGYADEAVAAVIASIDSATRGDDWQESYDTNVDKMQARRNAFTEENPWADLGANVVGGVLTGGLAFGPARAAAGVASKLPQALQGAGKVGATAGTLSLEGAVAGYGSGQPGQREEAAKTGAILAPALGGAMHGLGAGVRKWNTRGKSFKDMVDPETGKFVPITQAADEEGTRGMLYRDIVSQATGARRKMREQAMVHIQPKLDRIKELKKEIKAAKTASSNKKKELGLAATNAAEEVRALNKAVADRMTRLRREEQLLKRQEASLRKQATASDNAKRIANEVEQVQEEFRSLATSKSIGVSADKAFRDKLSKGVRDAHNRVVQLEEWWINHGFDFMRGKTHNVSPAKLAASIKEIVLDSKAFDDPDLTTARELLDSYTASGTISGEDFLTVRNTIAAMAKKLTYGKDAEVNSVKTALRRMVSALDDRVGADSTSPKVKSDLEAEKKAYATYINFSDATKRATNANAKGHFDSDDWVETIKKNNDRLARKGKGPLQDEAYAADIKSASRKAAAESASDAIMREQAEQARLAIGELEDKLNSELATLNNAARQAKQAARRGTMVNARKASEEADLAVEAMQDEIERVKEVADELKSLSISGSGAGTATRIASTVMIGTIITMAGMPIGGTVAIYMAGLAMAKSLSTEGMQKFIAGPTGAAAMQSPKTIQYLQRKMPKTIEYLASQRMPEKIPGAVARAGVIAKGTNDGEE